jgi:hypothetical protein
MKKITTILMIAVLLFVFVGVASAEVNSVTPSTNDINKTNGWAHVNEISSDVGEVTLELVSTRNFYSCFEYRTDGDTTQGTGVNPNPAIVDGLYPYFCEKNSHSTHTFYANEYVEVRMVFGAENDERFDWTKFYVIPDVESPITSSVLASPNPAAVNSSVAVTANVDDSTTGGSNVACATYEIFDSNNVSVYSGSMSAVDVFDSPTEDVTANVTAPATPGLYDLCVRGTDVPGNVAIPDCTLLVVYDPSGAFVTGGGWIDSPAGAVAPIESAVFFNGFETDINDWYTPTRVMSGNNGIPSASGSYHAEMTGDYTYWGGSNAVFPMGGYITSIDVYLNMGAGYANDTRFDWTSAIGTPGNGHRRDFIFNGGFYNDLDGPGAGQNRFVFSASNNAPGWPKNPGRDPFAISTTGWYTLQHRFYDSGAGVLAVDLSILDSAGNVLHTWTLSDPSDVIGTTVGGNQYGWFARNYFPFLAVDNSVRKEFSFITGKATFGFVSKYKKGATVPDGNTEFQFKAGNLNFHSTRYDWLVVNQGGTNAQFKGSGTINGAGEYQFMLWAGDGSPDTFRIKIWDADTEVVVYDNGMDQPIGGGSIVVKKK